MSGLSQLLAFMNGARPAMSGVLLTVEERTYCVRRRRIRVTRVVAFKVRTSVCRPARNSLSRGESQQAPSCQKDVDSERRTLCSVAQHQTTQFLSSTTSWLALLDCGPRLMIRNSQTPSNLCRPSLSSSASAAHITVAPSRYKIPDKTEKVIAEGSASVHN